MRRTRLATAALELGRRRTPTDRLVCITVTGVVYYAVLAGDQHFVGIAKVGDVLAHFVSPLLYIGTWLFGSRGLLQRRHVGQSLVFPVLWIALTLVRGAIIHIYPYGFVDVAQNGYVAVLVTIVVMLAAAGAMAAGAARFDRRRRSGELLDGPVRAFEATLG